MYASVDLVSHRLTRLLRKYKDRKLGKRKAEGGFEEDAEAEIAALNAAAEAMAGVGGGGVGGADFEDPAKAVDMRVVKRKQFDMPPMAVSYFLQKKGVVCGGIVAGLGVGVGSLVGPCPSFLSAA